ncbi:MAG: OB-fold putative lipoprotein [Candidatus Adiutrix sp.]|jgi:hypothetical protein|nr:OB-fold putative lipoprotein [Candidatus Adiutrix sp.]
MNRFNKIVVIAVNFILLLANISQGFADDSVMLANPMQLMEEFRENALALEMKYAGRQIEISGVITEIKRDKSGLPIVRLVNPPNHIALDSPFGISYPPPLGQAITCQYKEDQTDELIKLKRGQQIEALCDNLNTMDSSVMLANCKFIKLQ